MRCVVYFWEMLDLVCLRYVHILNLWQISRFKGFYSCDFVSHFSSMARLDAAFEEVSMMGKDMSKRNQKTRLVADPMISVGQLQNTFEQFMRYRKSTDFWELVAPPASLAIANWQTPPNPQWIAKTMNLLYDILEFAPNTKLQASKVYKALHTLFINKSMHIDHKLKVADAIDRMSLSLRIVLSMLKTIKTNETIKGRVMRNLSNQEQVKLNMVLKKVVLPKEFYDEVHEQDEDDSQEQLDLQPMQALVVAQPEPKKIATPQAAPSPSPPCSTSQKNSCLFSLAPLPGIFQRILKGKVSASQEPAQQSGMAGNDADLLESAMTVVPQVAQKSAEKTKKKPAGQKGKKVKPGLKSAKSVKTKTDKKEAKAQPAKATQVAEYKVDAYPTDRDSYRNLYVSRHHNKAKTLAIKGGLSHDEAKSRGRQAGAQASQMWDEYHSRCQ